MLVFTSQLEFVVLLLTYVLLLYLKIKIFYTHNNNRQSNVQGPSRSFSLLFQELGQFLDKQSKVWVVQRSSFGNVSPIVYTSHMQRLHLILPTVPIITANKSQFQTSKFIRRSKNVSINHPLPRLQQNTHNISDQRHTRLLTLSSSLSCLGGNYMQVLQS